MILATIKKIDNTRRIVLPEKYTEMLGINDGDEIIVEVDSKAEMIVIRKNEDSKQD
jgi:bifunctional DNA-binding transcriptional regulator/antitoxin component of YhaV-PrlF toxin-antitoxin module